METKTDGSMYYLKSEKSFNEQEAEILKWLITEKDRVRIVYQKNHEDEPYTVITPYNDIVDYAKNVLRASLFDGSKLSLRLRSGSSRADKSLGNLDYH